MQNQLFNKYPSPHNDQEFKDYVKANNIQLNDYNTAVYYKLFCDNRKERQRAEEERQRAEEARREADEERQRNKRLSSDLDTERSNNKRLSQRAEEEKQRADAEAAGRLQEKQRADEADQRADKLVDTFNALVPPVHLSDFDPPLRFPMMDSSGLATHNSTTVNPEKTRLPSSTFELSYDTFEKLILDSRLVTVKTFRSRPKTISVNGLALQNEYDLYKFVKQVELKGFTPTNENDMTINLVDMLNGIFDALKYSDDLGQDLGVKWWTKDGKEFMGDFVLKIGQESKIYCESKVPHKTTTGVAPHSQYPPEKYKCRHNKLKTDPNIACSDDPQCYCKIKTGNVIRQLHTYMTCGTNTSMFGLFTCYLFNCAVIYLGQDKVCYVRPGEQGKNMIKFYILYTLIFLHGKEQQLREALCKVYGVTYVAKYEDEEGLEKERRTIVTGQQQTTGQTRSIAGGSSSGGQVDAIEQNIYDNFAKLSVGASNNTTIPSLNNITQRYAIEHIPFEIIGHGRCGEVLKTKVFNQDAALKVANSFKDTEADQMIEQELKIYQHIKQHGLCGDAVPNVIAGGYTAEGFRGIATEFIACEEIKEGQEGNVRQSAKDALQKLHDIGVLHNDIKIENILIQGDKALIIDFGIACLADKGDKRFKQEKELLEDVLKHI